MTKRFRGHLVCMVCRDKWAEAQRKSHRDAADELATRMNYAVSVQDWVLCSEIQAKIAKLKYASLIRNESPSHFSLTGSNACPFCFATFQNAITID